MEGAGFHEQLFELRRKTLLESLKRKFLILLNCVKKSTIKALNELKIYDAESIINP